MIIISDFKEPYDCYASFEKEDYKESFYERKTEHISLNNELNKDNFKILKEISLKFDFSFSKEKEVIYLNILCIGEYFYPVARIYNRETKKWIYDFSLEYMNEISENMKSYKDYLKRKKSINFNELINLIPDFSSLYHTPVWLYDIKNYYLIKNPLLYENNLNLEKWEVFQEIERWFNIRPVILNNIIIPDEKFRKNSRFGHKYAFRKEPEKK